MQTSHRQMTAETTALVGAAVSGGAVGALVAVTKKDAKLAVGVGSVVAVAAAFAVYVKSDPDMKKVPKGKTVYMDLPSWVLQPWMYE